MERFNSLKPGVYNQRLTDGNSEGILEQSRCSVPSEIPSSVDITLQDAPPERIEAILARSTLTVGRPSRLPLARALRTPARTRSMIRDRSNSATAPRTVKIILPVGVEVSICSE